jgi:hypothetical protein
VKPALFELTFDCKTDSRMHVLKLNESSVYTSYTAGLAAACHEEQQCWRPRSFWGYG